MDVNSTMNNTVRDNSGLISYQTYKNLNFGISVLNIVVVICGVSTNIINLVVFIKSGIGRCPMTLSFVSLTVTDLSFLVLILPFLTLHFLIGIDYTDSTIPLKIVGVMLLPYWHMAYSMSICVTVFISLFKTCCVAMPLKCKNMFTRKRILTTLMVITLVLLAFHLPLITTMTISQRWDPKTNSSVYYLKFYGNPSKIINVFNASMLNVLPTLALVVVIVCLIILVKKLRESVEFRRKHGSGGEHNQGNPSKHSAKEIQAVKAVSVVSIMFVTCNLPPVLVIYAQYVEPEFNDLGRYAYLYVVVNVGRLTLMLVCASLNILVYLKFNSRYRLTLLTMIDRDCPSSAAQPVT